ncbi:ABC transporter substrate-binding protein [Pseudooctadecabacter jejudonensis]|uniref:Bacterial extracellular solute-binding protein n=1 Tax=Pseudooctadecabacter jejudonensis TaxID=1391910 RepID=A0A1Y5S742_9RHOB|nr:ABC transporter substrate-binding protein [Pseudooctadecabacter jejudonensis]SLN33025.1 hypothetical protein PSJ8397_01571 [Pseudooctadecabacter jejudonensis]
MRIGAVLILWLLPWMVAAQDWEDRQVFGAGDVSLRILSSTDTSFFAPIIEDFLRGRTDVSVEYLVTGTADLDARFRAAPDGFDVVISSAMDLQLKLANDGFAAQVSDTGHPAWAKWRDSLFAFTAEPAAIVINRRGLGALPVPQTRQDMIALMRDHSQVFEGRVGTYDVRQSGLGYLFATQDARASETYWRLIEVMGRMGAHLYCCSGAMIDDLVSGDLVVAYNVLGSYAEARAEEEDALLVILPSEFPTTMMRTVLVSGKTRAPDLADAFVRHVLAVQASGDAERFPLPSLTAAQRNPTIISLDPALMTYLDQMKRAIFIREWEDAILQDG